MNSHMFFVFVVCEVLFRYALSFLYVLFVSLFVYGSLLLTAHLKIQPARVEFAFCVKLVVDV